MGNLSEDSCVLVLGGSGFIGWNLCRALVRKGVRVHCLSLDRPPANSPFNEGQEQVHWFLGEFSNEYLVEKALEGVDYLFHLICTTIPATSNQNLELDLSGNIPPTLKLLRAAANHDVRKIVFISSGGAIYGIPDNFPISEDHDTHPICGYGVHKLAIEHYLFLHKYLFGLDYSILRLANPYGKEQISNRSQGVIGKFMFDALSGRSLDLWGDGEVVRDFIYIEDVIEAFFKIIEYDGPDKIFNIGSGCGHSLNEIVAMMEQVLGRPLEIRHKPGRRVDVPINILDPGLAWEQLGWRPRTEILDGIRLMHDFGRRLLAR